MITFDEFQAEWLGKRVDYDHIYGFQCVDLIRQGFYEMYNLPGGGGVPSAITYWQATPDEVLQRFIRIPNSDAQKGDVVILWGLPGNADGHIGWATGNETPTAIEILEQNGSTGNGSGIGGDAIRTRFIDRSRVAGLLRPIAVPETPPAPTIIVTPYATPQQWTHNGNLWNLDQPNFDAIAGNPLPDTNPNPVTITAYLTRSDLPDKVYLLPDPSVHHGYNQVDCTVYTPPPAPYVPPATPNKGTPPETYEVFVTLDGFQSASDANRQQNSYQPVAPGSNYFVFARDIGMINITKDNMKAGVWINPKFNELPPVPAPVPPSLPVDIVQPDSTPVDVTPPPALAEQGSVKKLTYDWIRGDRQPVWFHTLNVTEQRYKDLENPDAPQAVLPPNKDIRFSMMTYKNGMNYYVPTLSLNNGNRHGIPETMLRELAPAENFLESAETDVIDWTRALIETPAKRAYQLLHDVTPRLSKAGYQAKQFVDGFKKGTRK